MQMAFLFFILLTITLSRAEWQWICQKERGVCERIFWDSSYNISDHYPSVEVCHLVCGDFKGLWPKPTFVLDISNNILVFNLIDVEFKFLSVGDKVKKYMIAVGNIFKESLYKLINYCQSNNYTRSKVFQIELNITREENLLTYATDESYSLHLYNTDYMIIARIEAQTIFGARHALETLSQLTAPYKTKRDESCIAVHGGILIHDKPFYKHRGLLLDTARNFLSIENIMKHIDAMASSKMNILHWHITDTQSFGFVSKRVPNMHIYGAYSPTQVYTSQAIEKIKEYAIIRGIRIVMEIDAPSHMGYGWQWGPSKGLGDLIVCLNQPHWIKHCWEPPCGQVNPRNANVYAILAAIYADILDIFPQTDIFHMGGDEVLFRCWRNNTAIKEHIERKQLGTPFEAMLRLWGDFQQKVSNEFDKVKKFKNTTFIVWSSTLTTSSLVTSYLPTERYIIQLWVTSKSLEPERLSNLGYYIIMSTKNAWYLDHGFWGRSRYYKWTRVYDNTLLDKPNVLGGEVKFRCWKYSSNKKDQSSMLRLWGQFQQNALKEFDKEKQHKNTSFIVWSSSLTESDLTTNYLPTGRYIIQLWEDVENIQPLRLLRLGYSIILSTTDAWYLDHGFWGIWGKKHYYTWKKVYDNILLENPNVLGGEICMWGELVDDNCIETRTWPRAAAGAERLWSNPNTTAREAAARFYQHRHRLVTRLNIHAEAVVSQWCYQNEGLCYT